MQFSQRHIGLAINLFDLKDVQASIDAAADHAKNNANLEHGKLDILVNAAGWPKWQMHASMITVCAFVCRNQPRFASDVHVARVD